MIRMREPRDNRRLTVASPHRLCSCKAMSLRTAREGTSDVVTESWAARLPVAVLRDPTPPEPTLYAVYRKTADAHRIGPSVQYLAAVLQYSPG